MYKIALVCEHGASTGLCVRKMVDASLELGTECDIAAYSLSKLENIVGEMDCVLFGPQISFKLDKFKKAYTDHAAKMTVINSMDFGMMNGDKILKDAIKLIEKNHQ